MDYLNNFAFFLHVLYIHITEMFLRLQISVVHFVKQKIYLPCVSFQFTSLTPSEYYYLHMKHVSQW